MSIVGQLEEVMRGEISLLESFAEGEQELQDHLIKREWVALQAIIEKLSGCAEEILEVESLRHKTYRKAREEVGSTKHDGFYDFLAYLPIEARSSLSHLHRQLKVSVMRVQSLTGGIDAYSNESARTLRSILDEVLPQNRGRMYSRSGNPDRGDERALVVDTHL